MFIYSHCWLVELPPFALEIVHKVKCEVDELVKVLFKEASSKEDTLPLLPILPEEYEADYKLISRKPILPNEAELSENSRSQSAKLRIIERIKK